MAKQVWEHSMQIKASAVMVDRCLTELELVQRWSGGCCEPIGDWTMAVGSGSRLRLAMRPLRFTLSRILIVREPGLLVWGFDGLLSGRERWECQPNDLGTLLINRWEIQSQRWLSWGGQWVIRSRLAAEMQNQLIRLKEVAEDLHYRSGFQ